MRLQSFLTLFTHATPGTPARGGNGEEEGKVEKSWQGPGVGRKGGGGRLDKKEWGGEGRQDWDNGEETGRGQWRGEDGEGGNGKGETGGWQRGGGEEGARGGGILQMDTI